MNFISEAFLLHYIASYTLFIQSNYKEDYLIVVGEDNEVVVFLQYDNTMPSVEATQMLSLPFQKVIIGMAHQNLVWVPSEVFEVADKHLYTAYFLDENVESILHKEFDQMGAVALYQYDKLMLSKWNKIFPEAKLVPSFEVLMNQTIENVSSGADVLGVHVSDSQVDMLLFVNGEFKLYNTFEVATADDLSYFVLSIMKNFSLDGKIQRIVYSGSNEDAEYSIRLNNYTNELVNLQAKNIWTSDDEGLQQALLKLNLLADTVLCV